MAVSILGTVTPVTFTPDATSRSSTAHTCTAGTGTLLVVIMTRAYDATNPPGTWTVTWDGVALTEAANNFAGSPAAGRACTWIGYLESPASGAKTLSVSTGSLNHRGPSITLYNLAGAKTGGSPLGALSQSRSISPAGSSTTLSIAAQSATADNLLVAVLMKSINDSFSSFSGTGTWTDVYTGQFGNYPYGTSRYRLGATGTVSAAGTWTAGTASLNVGGALFEVLAAPTTFDVSVGESLTPLDAGALPQPSRAALADLAWLSGLSSFTWFFTARSDVVDDDRIWVRVGDAASASFVARARLDNGFGAANVWRFVYALADGQVTADSETGTQTTAALALALTSAPGATGRVYVDGEPQDGYRTGGGLTGGLAPAGTLEIGRHAAAAPEPFDGLLGRVLVAPEAWPAAKVALVSQAVLDGRSVYGLGDEETPAEALARADRSPVALPMRLSLGGPPSLSFEPAVSDPSGTGWVVASAAAPANGTLEILGPRLLRYTPTGRFEGVDILSYVVAGSGKSSAGQARVTVDRPALLALPDAITVTRDSTGYVFDPLGNDVRTPPVRIVSVSVPPNGTASVTADGQQVRYAPRAGYTGADSFAYTVADAFQSATATISVTVVAPATGFVTANDDSASTPRGVARDIAVLGNDTASGPFRVTAVTAPARGTAAIVASGAAVRYAPASGYEGADSFAYTAALDANPSLAATATVRVSVTAPSSGNWVALDWGGAVEPGSGRPWNIGVMSVQGAGVRTVNGYLGFQQTVAGGRHFLKTDDPNAFRADTWEKMMGGPVTGGDAITLPGSMVNLGIMGAQEWLNRTNGFTTRHWAYWGICPVPFGTATVATIREVIAGLHDDKYRRIGSRLRYLIDSKGQDYRKVICRFAYEFNQDTGFAVDNGPGLPRGFFSGPDTSLAMWRDFCSRAIAKIREGYGYAMKMVLSPAYESTTVAARFGFLKIEDLLVPEFDVCCGSYHTVDYRIDTEAKALATVRAVPPAAGAIPTSTRYTPRYIAQVARATGRKLAFLEHNLPTEDPSYFDGDLSWAATAYSAFGQECNDNADIMAFTCLLGTAMCSETFPATVAVPNNPSRTIWWRDLARAYRAGFGKVG